MIGVSCHEVTSRDCGWSERCTLAWGHIKMAVDGVAGVSCHGVIS